MNLMLSKQCTEADGRGSKRAERIILRVSSKGGSAAKISTWGLDYLNSLHWLDNETLVFSGNDELNDLLVIRKQLGIFKLNVKTKEFVRVSPGGVYTSQWLQMRGKKIIYTGPPSKDFHQ
ncbi:MAG: hypothetical protein CM15mP22_7370 [Gammaproteobacteria bacterium]|nr:MAG: hypothetical protein CM15mP22_7370 [Gammaproteobacteria bacterium]